MGKKRMTWRRTFILSGILTLAVVLLCHSTVYALDDSDAVRILTGNESLFESNSIGGSVLRYIGWGLTKGLAAVGKAAASLYDTCFGFIDFTTFPEVSTFIDKWKPVFIALVCLSLLLIGILLCVGWEKKPKIVINLLIAVTVVTSSTWVIKEMNSFISSGVRNEILDGEGGTSVVYNVVGTNVHDLVYLDQTIGLENLNKKGNADKVYKKFTEAQFQNISINETVDPDDVSDEAEKIVANGIQSEFYDNSRVKYSLDELYDGVAWTDLLNEYYYRYTVDWGAMWMELLSLAIIYLFMSYKVIRCLYEIVVHQLLAYLYAANLNNNQKILKILDSLKDSYILLLMTTVMIKFYLIACHYIADWDIAGLAKGFILLFLAFAVIDGPNLVQKLTGADMGASDGMGKMMSLFYGSQMVGGAARTVTGAAKFGAGAVTGAVKSGKGKGKELYDKAREHLNGSGGAGASTKGMEEETAGTGKGDAAGSDPADKLNQNGRQADRMPEGGNTASGQEENKGKDPEVSPDGSSGMPEGNMGEEDRDGKVPGMDQTEIPEPEKDGDGNSSDLPDNKKMGSGQNSMDQIGKGMQNSRDALNGLQTEGKKDSYGDAIDRMLNSMDQDVRAASPENGMNPAGQGKPAGHPIDTGGHIFRDASALSEQRNSEPEGRKISEIYSSPGYENRNKSQ